MKHVMHILYVMILAFVYVYASCCIKFCMQGLKHTWFVFTARTEQASADLIKNFKSKMECFHVIDRFMISPRTKGA